MARYNVYLMADSSLVLDLQSDELYATNTRIVAPLIPQDVYKKPIPRANPALDINGETYLLLAHFLSAVPTRELQRQIANLKHEQYKISAALDMLFFGF